MRRLSLLVWAVAVVAALCGRPIAVSAQGATPTAQDATFPDTMGLPEIQVAATDTTFEGVPTETAAGRYLVTFTNNATDPEGAAIHFMQLPEGFTVEMLTMPPPDAVETPMAGMGEGSPVAEEGGNAEGTPDWFYEVYQAGGTIALPGRTAQVILDLIPGNYAVWGGFPDLPQAPVGLTVTGDMGASPMAGMAEPTADVTVTEVKTADGYVFDLEGTLTPGLNVIEIVNDSDQPHFFFVERYPEPITLEQVQAFLMFDPSMGTPPAGIIDESLLELTVSASTQSAGTTQWLAVNLEPGSHIISCFVEDPTQGGIPHAFEGMIDVIQVGDEGTPAS
ncbi:MAG: hypothetical protein M3Q03_20530 [Chloroflexota bacterium]|nr:hypothetical protein [Chloroflexota bacterium]